MPTSDLSVYIDMAPKPDLLPRVFGLLKKTYILCQALNGFLLQMQLLREIPRSRAEWVVWMDMDIIIDRMDFKIPLASYEGKDFVIWGREDKISQGDTLNGA